MAFPARSERWFERLDYAMHERLPFSTVSISRSLSSVFEEHVYNPGDLLRVLAEFEANGEKSCHGTSGTSEEIMYDEGRECAEVYLALSGVPGRNNCVWRRVMQMVELVSIPDSVEELCDGCFSGCTSLSRVTFGDSSSLKLIGKKAFSKSSVS